MTSSAARSLTGPFATGLLLSVCAACAEPTTTTEATFELSDTPFFIRALGNRCIGVTDRTETGLTLVIEKCNDSINQMFHTAETGAMTSSSSRRRLLPSASPSWRQRTSRPRRASDWGSCRASRPPRNGSRSTATP
jgi:hypothetical protein